MLELVRRLGSVVVGWSATNILEYVGAAMALRMLKLLLTLPLDDSDLAHRDDGQKRVLLLMCRRLLLRSPWIRSRWIPQHHFHLVIVLRKLRGIELGIGHLNGVITFTILQPVILRSRRLQA